MPKRRRSPAPHSNRLRKEFIAVESIIERLSGRYEETVLRTVAELPEVTPAIAEDLDALSEWADALSAGATQVEAAIVSATAMVAAIRRASIVVTKTARAFALA